MDEMGAFPCRWPRGHAVLLRRTRPDHASVVERGVLPAVRRHFNAERRHWRHRGQIEARRAFSVTDGRKIKRAQCARFIFDIALQRSCLHCNFSATKRAFSRRSAPSCKKFSLEKIRKKHQNHTVLMLFGGDKRDRTADLLTASQALSQLVRLHTPLNRAKRVLQYAGNPKTHPECFSL